MNGLPPETDFVVIGAGIAGLRAAIELAYSGRVLVLAKKEAANSSAPLLQDGISTLNDEEEVSLHLQETLKAGDGLCNPDSVKILREEAPQSIEELLAWGTRFDRTGAKLAFDLEKTHSRNHSLRATEGSTGTEILRALFEKAQALMSISIAPFAFSTSPGVSQDAARA